MEWWVRVLGELDDLPLEGDVGEAEEDTLVEVGGPAEGVDELVELVVGEAFEVVGDGGEDGGVEVV